MNAGATATRFVTFTASTADSYTITGSATQDNDDGGNGGGGGSTNTPIQGNPQRDAVAALAELDAPDLRAECLVALANVLSRAGRLDEARSALREAADLYAAKGYVVSAERAVTLAEALPSSAEAAQAP